MGERIRVMHFRRTSHIVGGPETLLYAIGKYTDRERFDVTVADFGADAEARTPFLREFDQYDIPTVSIPAGHKWDFRSIRELAAVLEEREIDILHTHDHRTDLIGYLASRRRPTATVVTFWQPLRRYWWLKHIEILDDHIIRRFDRILPCAEAVRDEIVRKSPHLADRCITVLNRVDLDLYKQNGYAGSDIRAEFGIPADAFVCATVGRVMEDKGITYLVDAQKLIADAGVKVHQLIVGTGPQVEEMTEKVRFLGLADRVTFTGHRRDIPAVLKACDLLIQSSLSEGLSIAVVEAMAAGLAVVATDVGGTTEIVKHGATGLIIQPRKPKEIADGVLALHADSARRESMAKAARETAFREWSVEKWVRQFEEVYVDLVAERGHGAAQLVSQSGTL